MDTPPRSRLIDWTGERMVPWGGDVQVAYEHLHRYWFASTLVAGSSVLDLGCGEGYGSAILASAAASVVGIDVDARAIEHCVANYSEENLQFLQGSALDLTDLEEGGFGAVVCFEVIEHLAEQEQLLDQIDRVLAPDGVLICSTPEASVYSAPDRTPNEFHVRELGRNEFDALLARHFDHRRTWGQRTVTGSLLYESAGAHLDGQAFFAARNDGVWGRAPAPAPMYLVAMASRQHLPQVPSGSVLADSTLALLKAAEEARASALEQQARCTALGAAVVGARVVAVARGFGAAGQDSRVIECTLAPLADMTCAEVSGYVSEATTLELRVAGAERSVDLVGGPFVVSIPASAREGTEIDAFLTASGGWRLHELRFVRTENDPRHQLPSDGRIAELSGGFHADGWVTDDARCVVELRDDDPGLHIAGWRPNDAAPAPFTVRIADEEVLRVEVDGGDFAVDVPASALPGRRFALKLSCLPLPVDLTSADESRALSWRLLRLGGSRTSPEP